MKREDLRVVEYLEMVNLDGSPDGTAPIYRLATDIDLAALGYVRVTSHCYPTCQRMAGMLDDEKDGEEA